MNKISWREASNCYRRYLDLNLPPTACFIYRNSNNMVPAFQGGNAAGVFGYDAFWGSQDVVVVGDEASGEYILVGATSARCSLTFFHVEKRGRLVGIEMWQPNILPGDEPEKTVILTGGDWRKLLQEYADLTAREMNALTPDAAKNYCGYCTWYYYYASVSEANLLENLEHLAANIDKFPTAVAQIDDGYQPFQGDWLEQRDAWPTPLEDIAGKITEKGMIPGIWTMPLIASTASRVFRDHPEWFVKRADGEPFVFAGWSPPPDNCWVCLDATNPEVKAHLSHVFKTLRSWGFKYFKMDALGFCMPEGVRFDPNATPVSAFREGIKAVRDAVPDSVLLGCGAPYMAVIGLVDNCRVSPDTLASWSGLNFSGLPLNGEQNSAAICVRTAYHNTVGNWWMFDKYFRADPDVVIVRQDKSSLTIGESRISAVAGVLTGVLITSDNLGTLNSERLSLLSRAAKLRLHNPVPQNWLPDFWPYCFTGKIDGKNGAVFVNDSEEEITFTFQKFGLNDSCEELLHPLGDICGSITVSAHDAVVIVEK